MRSNAGSIATAIVALFLGILAVTQVRAQDVYSRSLELETPSSLTTLIANLAETNNTLRAEIFDLRLRTEQARDDVTSGKGTLTEAQRQLEQLDVFAARTGVTGQGISVKVDGAFDEKALNDLVNELRNAGAEAIAVNGVRVGPRSWFGITPDRALTVDATRIRGPWTVSAVGAPDVMYVAMTRTGGIIGQFELIYRSTRFSVAKENALSLPSLAQPPRG
ncbi:MAG TPA: DUF881 domain-containing protein [Candidatus Acidoferrales bacterium]|nr:DUF881 domain-containing protein [Candidatus Acidoferrales bacterium]